ASVIEGEALDLIVGSKPIRLEENGKDKEEENGGKEAVKKALLGILKEYYGIDEEDFVSAELEVVPAGKARDAGFDRSMILGYGHDDRSCAYPSFRAQMEAHDLDRTSCTLLVDKEEIGSVGATGMQSRFFENALAEVMELCGQYSELSLRRTLANSCMLSSDVSAAFDPSYAAAFEKKNAAFMGMGLAFNKFTGARGKSGSNDANAEYIAHLRQIFEEEKICTQTAELGKVDVGGGGTIAYILALYGMNVIDCGVPVLSMHSPWEAISKADLYAAFCGYKAFFQNASFKIM
ncbi:MAG: aminopeptidase, partial [Lachnospiraceae bacterium]|nr:aminopeptidase [Lachnospiraceae bacterium]